MIYRRGGGWRDFVRGLAGQVRGRSGSKIGDRYDRRVSFSSGFVHRKVRRVSRGEIVQQPNPDPSPHE